MNGKDNSGPKLRFDLIPTIALRGMAQVFTIGAKKHGDRGGKPNWIDGLSFASHYGAALRHMNAWWSGEEFDEEGFHHLDAATANLAILRDMAARHTGTEHDDRPPPVTGASENKPYPPVPG